MRKLFLSLATCTILLITAVTLPVRAEEARCGQLGASCVCSEPFQMTSFTHPVGAWNWNPNDSTTKECGEEAVGAPIARNTQDLIGSLDATALSKLPTGNSVSRFMTAPTGHTSTFFVGATTTIKNLGATFNRRVSMRGYIYHSPEYNFGNDNPACHSKFLQGQVGSWHIENALGDLAMYQFTNSNWGPSSIFPRDCCWGSPGAQVHLTKQDWRGRWFRVEVVVTNRAGGPSPNGVRYVVYMKDVTKGVTQINGGNEFVANDWRVAGPGPAPWGGWDNITSNPAQANMAFNLYRSTEISSPNPHQCLGFRAISHMMVAGWDTDSGQRIGSALEVEGVSGAINGSGTGTGTQPVRPPPPVLQ